MDGDVASSVQVCAADLLAAQARLRRYLEPTPLHHAERFGCWLKLENLQRTGSYKVRGALNALLAARENKQTITAEMLEEAVDRVIGGPRRKSRIISEHEKKVVAYHEGGHTLAAWAMPDLDPIYKVTILARGRTGGHALAVP